MRTKIEKLNPINTPINEPDHSKKLHLTKQAEKALKTTFLEAKLYQENAVNTAHLLLCILRNENDPTTKVLQSFDINYESVKSVFKELKGESIDINLPTAETNQDDEFESSSSENNPYGSKTNKGKTNQNQKPPF